MMNCPTKDHLAELAMAVANKEVLSPEIEAASAHTSRCAECRTLLRSYLETIGAVRKAIEADADTPVPGECPDFNSLAAYVDDALSPEERDELERHAAHCTRCLQEMAELTELKVNLPAAAPVFSYLVDITKAGLAILRHPANGFELMTAEPVPVLGATDVAAVRQEWTQSEGSLSLHFGLSKVNDCHVDLDLCVRREEQLLPQGRLDLWRHGSLVQSEALSATGEIFLPNLEADNYEGEVTTPSGESIFFSLELQTE